MKRIPEPELMLDAEQANAYAAADFSASDNAFVDVVRSGIGDSAINKIIDLGCGPGNISFPLAQSWPQAQVLAIDGAEVMMQAGIERQKAECICSNLCFECRLLPDASLPVQDADLIVSNSLLHHLHDPQVFWQTVRHCLKPGGYVYLMDLYRPDSEATARQLTQMYTADEAPVLQEDFYNSLCAAFTAQEIEMQLEAAGISGLKVEYTDDRHVMIYGRATILNKTDETLDKSIRG